MNLLALACIAGSSAYRRRPAGPANLPPVAGAGPDQSGIAAGATVTLAGSASDADGSVVSTVWSQLSGTGVTLSNVNILGPTFTAPAGPATLVFRLTVTDNSSASTPDDVTIAIASGGTNYQLVAPPSNITFAGSSGLATISWLAPQFWEGADVTPLAPGDIAGYKLYWSTNEFNLFEGGGFTGSDATILGSALSKAVALAAGTYYFAVASINSSGQIGTPSAVQPGTVPA